MLKNNRRKGFTLIELLLVILIMGVLLTIGTNISIRTTRRKNLSRVANEIKIGIRKAKDDAYNGKIYDNRCQRFMGKIITIDANGYEIEDNCESGLPPASSPDQEIESFGFGFRDIEVDPNPAQLEFPYLTSGAFPDASITVTSGDLEEIIEIRGGHIVE